MKKYEVKRIGPLSFFKTFLYILLIPLTLYLLLGLIILITGFATGDDALISGGLNYLLNTLIIVFLCGLVSVIVPNIYNIFAKYFGGLQLTLEEKDQTGKLNQ